MIIVSGWLRVAAAERSGYLRACQPVIESARATRGCLDFHLAADPVEPDRINVFEQWESTAAVEAFRADGPEPALQGAILAADVRQHEIASTRSLT